MKIKFWVLIGVLAILIAMLTISGCTSSSSSDTKPAPTAAPTSVVQATQKPTAAPTSAPVGFSKNNPAPVGRTIGVTSTGGLVPYTASITIKDITLGADALNKLKANDKYNFISAPADGKEYLVATISFQLTATDQNEDSYYLNPLSFDAVVGGTVYPSKLLIGLPDGVDISGSLYPGGSKEGWVTFEIPQGSSAPLIVFDRNQFTGTGGVWFSTV